jgi:hypothetical protein
MLSKHFANPFLKGITQLGREVIIYLHLLITRMQIVIVFFSKCRNRSCISLFNALYWIPVL